MWCPRALWLAPHPWCSLPVVLSCCLARSAQLVPSLVVARSPCLVLSSDLARSYAARSAALVLSPNVARSSALAHSGGLAQPLGATQHVVRPRRRRRVVLSLERPGASRQRPRIRPHGLRPLAVLPPAAAQALQVRRVLTVLGQGAGLTLRAAARRHERARVIVPATFSTALMCALYASSRQPWSANGK